jgi:hypothetical protein
MQVSREHGDYSIKKSKESGRRERGDSSETKTEENNEDEDE